MTKSRIGWTLFGILIGAVTVGVTTIVASSDSPDIPVSAEGILVEAAWNTDWQEPGNKDRRGELEKVIEGSVSFKIDVPMKKIQKHMLDAGTWGKLSPNVSDYTATKLKEDEDTVVYKIDETLNPTKFPSVNALAATKVGLTVTVNKRAQREDAIAVRWALDADKESPWKRFNGRAYAVDLHTGKSMVLLTTSTMSGYAGIPDRVRVQLVEHYLAKAKDSLIAWLKTLD